MNLAILLLGISALIASISQILLKHSATKTYENHIKEYVNPWVISGYFLLFATTIINLFAYKKIEYKYGAIMETLAFVFVIFFSRILFQEKITKKKLLGSVLILAGIVVFNL